MNRKSNCLKLFLLSFKASSSETILGARAHFLEYKGKNNSGT